MSGRGWALRLGIVTAMVATAVPLTASPALAAGDTTPPVVTGTPDRPPNANGWYNAPVTVTWTSVDPVPSSGPPTVPAPTTRSLNGAGQTVVSGQASCDPAHNCATGSYGPVSIDKTAPKITYTVAPEANNNGWNKTAVTVTFTCTDALSGVASCTEPITLTDTGAGQTATGTAVDNAGNTATVTTAPINIDMDAPTISHVVSPAANAQGWRRSATVTFTCADALSSVKSCTSPVTLGEGANQSVTGVAVDMANNSATTVVTGINVDLTAPTISFTVTPAKNAAGWRQGASTVTFTCADALSGIASCPAPVTVPNDGADQIVTGTAVDNSGRSSTATVHVSIDTVSPVVTVVGATDGGSYSSPPAPSCSTTDATSGVATPATVNVTDDGLGNITATCAGGTDVAGNTAPPVSIHYFVYSGPAVTNVAVDPARITVGQSATLTATVTDPVAAVAAVEYFEGTDPGVGNGTPMTLSGGTATAALPSDLSVGTHTFTVRAQDVNGMWTSVTLPTATLTVALPAISGRVLNGANQGIGDVEVDVVDPVDHSHVIGTATTGSNGNYSVSVTSGMYDVVFMPPGTAYVPVTRTGIVVTTDTTLDVVLALVPHTFSGQFTDADHVAIPGVSVTLSSAGGQTYHATTGSDGRFSVTVQPATYSVSATGSKAAAPAAFIPAGFALSLGSVDLTADVDQDFQIGAVQLDMATTNSLTADTVGGVNLGITTSTDTSACPGQPGYTGSSSYGVTTDASGSATVVLLAGSRYTITATPPAHSGVATTSFPTAGPVCGDTAVTLPLTAVPSNINGRVLNGANQGIGDVEVDVVDPADHSHVIGTGTTSSNGNYLVNVAPGMYDVVFMPPGTAYVPVTKTGVVVTTDTTLDLVLVLVPRTFSGQFTDANHVAIPGVSLTLTNSGDQTFHATTGSDGRFSVAVQPASYSVTVTGSKAAAPDAFIPTGFGLSVGSYDLTNDLDQDFQIGAVRLGVTTTNSQSGDAVGGVNVGIDTSTDTSACPGQPGYTGSSSYAVTTDASGSATVVLLTGSRYTITATPPAHSGVATTSFPQAGPLCGDTAVTLPLTAVLPTINGRVLNGANQGIGDVEVDVVDPADHSHVIATGTSNSNGNYSVSVTAGTYDVVFMPSGTAYVPVTKTGVVVTTDTTLDVVLVLVPRTFSGQFTDANHAAIPGVSLTLNNSGGQTYHATTGSDGRFSVTVQPATYSVSATGSKAAAPAAFIPTGFGLSLGSFDLTADVDQDFQIGAVRLNMTTTSSLTGDAVGEVNLGIATSTDMSACAGQPGYTGGWSYGVTTDASGSATVVLLAGSRYTINASQPTGSGAVTTSFPPAGPLCGDSAVTLPLNTDIRHFRGTVVATDGGTPVPVPGATVRLGGSLGSFATTTDATGAFDIEAAAGSYAVSVTGSRLGGSDLPLANSYGFSGSVDISTADVTRTLTIHSTVVSVTALNPSGVILPGITVSLFGTPATVTLDSGDPYTATAFGTAVTGADGVAHIYVTTGLAYTTTAVPPPGSGYLATSKGASPVVVAPMSWDITLDPNVDDLKAFSGTVRDIHGTPVAGAIVRLDGGQHYSATTGADGAYRLDVAAGGYSLQVSGSQSASPDAFLPDSFFLSRSVTVTADTAQDVSVDAVNVDILARDDALAPIPSVTIAFSSFGSQHGFTVSGSATTRTTRADGHTQLLMLSGTTYTISATPPSGTGYLATTFNGTSPITQDTQVIIQFQNHTPTTPTCLTASSPTTSSPALTWCPLAGADHYVVYRDGVDIDTTSSTSYTDSSITGDGTYQYRVTAVSPDGFESAKSTPASVLVDTTAPVLGDPTVSPNPKPAGQTAHLTATATDAGSGVTGGEYYVGDTDPGPGNGTPMAVFGGTVTATIGNALGAGVYTLHVRAVDALGTWSATKSVSLTVVQLSSPTGLTALSPTRQDPVLTWTAAPGAVKYFVYRDGVRLPDAPTGPAYTDPDRPDGVYAYRVTAVDASGNETDPSNSVSVHVDKTTPTIGYAFSPAHNAAGWNDGAVTVTFTCADETGGSGLTRCTPPVTVSTETAGLAVTGTALDGAGNTATVTAHVAVDMTAPTIGYSVAPAANAAGWNRSAVTVTFTCDDALSGVASCPEPVTLSDDGAGQSVTGTAVDNAGNSASVTAAHINIDTIAPSIRGSASGTPNAAGWRNTPSTVTFTCADGLSGVDTCTDPVTLGEGADQSATGTATDVAGNSATATVSGVNIDLTPPTIAYTVAPAPNADGWNRGAVTVTFTCDDALSGVASCPDPVTLSGDGADRSVTGTAVDNAGNSASVTAAHIDIDTIAPTITGSASGTPNAAGWRNAASTVTFTCADGLSGVAGCTSPVTLGEGAGQSVTGTATDRAGNTATTTVSGVNIDLTVPTITYTTAPAVNAHGWNTTAVTVTFTCGDALSGVATCPAPVTVPGDGASQTVTGTAIDNSGNTATATATLNVDRTGPTVTGAATTPPNAAGWYHAAVTVHFTCADATSGVATCPDDVTLTGDGPNQFAAGTASDRAGNTTTATVGGINIDATPPVVSVTGPVNGGSYLQELLPTAACATTDATSGVATPATAATSDDGNGHYTTTCSGGTDVAGNTAAPVTVTYTATPAVRAVATNSRNVVQNSSVSITVPAGGVAAGDTVAVSVATGTFTPAVGCGDSQNNTYTVVADRNTGNGRLFVCTAHLTHALAAGDTVTATYPGFSGLSLVSVDAISALATNGTVDAATDTSGNNAAPGAGPVTTTQAGEVLLGVIAHGSVPTLTPGSGYTAVGAISAGSGSGRRTLTPEYRLAGGPGSYTATAVLSAGQFWQAAVIAYRTP